MVLNNLPGLNSILATFVSYYTGTYLIAAMAIILLFLVFLTSMGLDFKYSIVASLPLVIAFVMIGWFGASTYLAIIVLLIVGFIYGFTLVKLTGA